MTPVTLAEVEHRGSPNCYIGINWKGENAIIDKWGNTQCVNCYKCHTMGTRKEGCSECGGFPRSPERLKVIRALNTLKYGPLNPREKTYSPNPPLSDKAVNMLFGEAPTNAPEA